MFLSILCALVRVKQDASFKPLLHFLCWTDLCLTDNSTQAFWQQHSKRLRVCRAFWPLGSKQSNTEPGLPPGCLFQRLLLSHQVKKTCCPIRASFFYVLNLFWRVIHCNLNKIAAVGILTLGVQLIISLLINFQIIFSIMIYQMSEKSNKKSLKPTYIELTDSGNISIMVTCTLFIILNGCKTYKL